MTSLGEKLRTARLDQGLELSELSARTKISRKFLAAIEGDERQSIPGSFFYRSWSQQYARALSLDSALITAEIDQILLNEQAPRLPGQKSILLDGIKALPVTTPDRRSGGPNRLSYSFAVLVTVILGCSGLYAWWHQAAQAQDSPADRSSAVSASSVAIPAAGEDARVVTSPERSAAPAADADVQIEISATEQTWISISGDGKESFSGILHPAEIKTVAARDMARIRVGNAGGLQVRLNGKPIGPIGSEGQVRTVIINKAGFQILEAKPAV